MMNIELNEYRSSDDESDTCETTSGLQNVRSIGGRVAPEGRRGGGMPAPTMPIVLSPDAAAALSQEHGTQSFHYDPMVREECSGTSTISAEQVARVTEITGDYRTTAWRAPDDIRRREWAHRALEAAFADEPRRL